MTKPRRHSKVHIEAAPKFGAACFLCLLLCFGVLWPAPLSFAASEPVATETPKAVEEPKGTEPEPQPEVSTPAPPDNVVVAPPAVEPTPTPTPEPEPAPETPAVPEHERAWPIGADEAAAVVAELWDDGTFVIDGDGKAVGFETVEDVPWLVAGWADDIKRVIFADKVEAESLAHWFEGCANLTEIANVPAGVQDLTRAFYDCPKLVELPDEFAFLDEAVIEECFGFEEAAETLLITSYRGVDENVLAYPWELDGRELVNPDAPVPPAVEDPNDPRAPESLEDPEEGDILADKPPLEEDDVENEEAAKDKDVLDDADSTEPVEPEPDPAKPVESETPSVEDVQVNITVPSSVSMMLGAEGDNTAIIPVLAANRSERNVAIVGARLKRASQDLPGGSWSLTTESGATTFVQDARFTPLGIEATFDRPVVLAAGDEDTVLVWHGTFTDYGMKQLLGAAIDAGDAGLAYGSMIWIVAAA